PEYLAVCCDKEGSKTRTEMYSEYKANRDATPEAIKIAVPYIQELLKAMHIPVVEIPGFEADDIIGTLAKQAEKEDYQVYMVTPDKDFAQLVSENIFMYRPARLGNGIEIWGIPEVQNKFGVKRPEQVIDFLGMMGDASDNIPGLPGVGEKTAKKFIEEFETMENLLANTDKLKGKMKEKVEENKELGLLSKELAKILIDCDVTFDAKDYELSMPDGEKVQEIFEELEFRRLKDQFLQLFSSESSNTPAEETKKTVSSADSPKGKAAGAGQFSLFDAEGGTTENITMTSSRKTIKDTDHFYQTVQPGMGSKLFLQNLMKQTSVCFDTETTSLDPLEAQLVGIAFSWEAGKGFYLPFPEQKEEAQKIIEQLRPFFEAENIEKVGQNL